jgi:hypothetical protein
MMGWSRLVFSIASAAAALAVSLAAEAQAALHWIERPDEMQILFFEDYDRLGDRVRLLYQTMPSLEQAAGDPDGWTVNVYVVEIDAEGGVAQRRLKSGQVNYAALRLRRGRDEVFALPRSRQTGQAERLELWSATDGKTLSSAPPPSVLPRSASGRVPLIATDDGNLLVTTIAPSTRNAPAPPIEWYKLSAEGRILERGRYAHGADDLRVDGAFGAGDGRIGLLVRISTHRGRNDIETDLPTPIERTIGGRTLEVSVFDELRLLVTGGDAAERLSPALERSLIWGGQMQLPRDLPPARIGEQLAAQQRLVEDVELEYGARRTLLSSQNSNWPLVKRTATGYAALATVVADRDRDPPAAGPYLLEVGDDGKLRRELYLGPLAEALDAKFTDFAPADDDRVVLAGTREVDRRVVAQVTGVDERGEGEWTADLEAPAGPVDGIAGLDSSVWVFSHGLDRERRKTLLWVERVDENRRSALRTAAGAPTPGRAIAPPAQTPVPAPPPGPAPALETRPMNGCSCTCEELVELRSLAEQIARASGPGQTPKLPDEATMSKLMCMQTCLTRYLACGGER